ncbi:MAG: fasciclin domain-containing protein [Candidatus Sericytochromatia bacterium]
MKHRLILILCLAAVVSGPAWSQTAPAPASANSSTVKPDLIMRAAQAGTFTILLHALDVADLIETLQKQGPYTVFAPTDEAFKKLPKDTMQRLLKDKPMLRRFLLYHVLSGRISGKTIRDSETADTLSENEIHIRSLSGEYYLDNVARLTATDIEARNGLIHTIDRVLVPPYKTP